jgi:hypothetical protein
VHSLGRFVLKALGGLCAASFFVDTKCFDFIVSLPFPHFRDIFIIRKKGKKVLYEPIFIDE